jgi:hypothetical protein
MKSSNRLLVIFAAVIGLIAVVTLAIALATGNQQPQLLPDGTPQGVVQRYLLAIDNADYQTAYSYLSFPPGDKTTTYDMWRQSFNNASPNNAYRATLLNTSVSGTSATVNVSIDVFRGSGGLFKNPVSSSVVSFSLQNIGGAWKITNPTFVWWIY